MSVPRDYDAYVNLLGALVAIDVKSLKSDRSIGGYLALRVAADIYVHSGKFAFDVDFYRDEKAKGGVSTRLMDEPATDIARPWLVCAYTKAIAERFMSKGVLDSARIHQSMAIDELLRFKHGEKIILERASMNAIALMRGHIPSRKREITGPGQDLEMPSGLRL
jgi:hypothetical protein